MYYRVMAGSECYGCSENLSQAQAILRMHKDTKSGSKKETKISTMDLKIETVQGDYPLTGSSMPKMSYVAGRYPKTGEFK